MWIFDSYYKGCVELWSRERGLNRTSATYPPLFYMYLKNPSAHWEMIEGLENRYKIEECSFDTIFGSFQGQKDLRQQKSGREDLKQTFCAVSFAPWMSGKYQCYLADLD